MVALDWAIDEASRHHLPLHILRARQVPPATRVGPSEGTADGATPAALQEAVARAFALAPLLEVTESPVAEPAVALVEASKEASCLVVGARGRGRPCRHPPRDDVARRCFACRLSDRGCAGTSRAGCDTSPCGGGRGWLGRVRGRDRVCLRPGGGKAGALDRRARCDSRRRPHPLGPAACRAGPVSPVPTRTGHCGEGDWATGGAASCRTS
jgi:hypothetical protein